MSPFPSIVIVALTLTQASPTPEVQDPTDLTSQGLTEWWQWRGPLGTGVAPNGDPPTTWSEETNVAWKSPLPGLGHSTPIVTAGTIYLTCAIPLGDPVKNPTSSHSPGAHDNLDPTHRLSYTLLAIDRNTGRLKWKRALREHRPHEGVHQTGSWASNSPVTDGDRIFASFGSAGLYAVDAQGRTLWQRDLGDMRTKHGHGEGSSPALWGELLVVNWDHEGKSFVIALDASSGETRWKRDREEKTSWSTPLIVPRGDRSQVIVAATKRTRAYDLETGKTVWECGGLSDNVVASPVSDGSLVFVTSSYDFQSMLAIRLASARGDITGTDSVVWRQRRHTPYVPTPLLYEGLLFFPRHLQPAVSCLDASSGAVRFGPVRLPGLEMIFASPVGAGGRVYITGRDGTTVVLRGGPKFEILAVNRLEDSFSASPAIVGKNLILRGERFLYSLREE